MTDRLTEREKEVLELVASGATNKSIAKTLLIKESTVENHLHHIYRKLGIANRSQATAYVLRGGRKGNQTNL